MACASTFLYSMMGGLIIVNLLSSPSHAQDEVDALIEVKNMLYDPLNVLESWDSSLVSPCTWFHITCDSNYRVIRVDLGLSGLYGSLSPRIGDLTNLQYLNLYSNSLSGSLPANLGNLKSLISLSLSGNKFTGVIPSSLGLLSNLRFLDLNHNLLSGEIPYTLTFISLRMLDLSNNRLSGPVPVPLYRFGYQRFYGNPGLCGIVVRKPCPRN